MKNQKIIHLNTKSTFYSMKMKNSIKYLYLILKIIDSIGKNKPSGKDENSI